MRKSRRRIVTAAAVGTLGAAAAVAGMYVGEESLRRVLEVPRNSKIQAHIRRLMDERADEVSKRAIFDQVSAGTAARSAREQLDALRREARRTQRMLRGKRRVLRGTQLPQLDALEREVYGWIEVTKMVARACEMGDDAMHRPQSLTGRLTKLFVSRKATDIIPAFDFSRYLVAIETDLAIPLDSLEAYLRDALAVMASHTLEFANWHLRGLDEVARHHERLSDPTRVRKTLAEMAAFTVRTGSDLLLWAHLCKKASGSWRTEEVALLAGAATITTAIVESDSRGTGGMTSK